MTSRTDQPICRHCDEPMGADPEACPGRDDPGGRCVARSRLRLRWLSWPTAHAWVGKPGARPWSACGLVFVGDARGGEPGTRLCRNCLRVLRARWDYAPAAPKGPESEQK